MLGATIALCAYVKRDPKMIVPWQQLSQEAIDHLVKDYCLRDWGINDVEQPLEDRQSQVMQALKNGQLKVLFSEIDQSARLVSLDEIAGQS